MPVCIIGAARTPWAPRHGPLSNIAPDMLLASALEAAIAQSRRRVDQIDRVLVACDTGVGAQALNIARRAVLALGWLELPALTIDGQGAGDLGGIELAARSGGVSLVGAVDATSTVPPGAGLVRDYGRPSQREPELDWLEHLASQAGLDRSQLDDLARKLTEPANEPHPGVVAVQAGSTVVDADIAQARLLDEQLEPLTGPGGVLTAVHHAALADGAAAVVVGPAPATPVKAKAVQVASLTAGSLDSVVERLAQPGGESAAVLVDPSVVIHQLVGERPVSGVASVLQTGSAPSADGLRALVDVFHRVGQACAISRRGSDGLLARVVIGPMITPGT